MCAVPEIVCVPLASDVLTACPSLLVDVALVVNEFLPSPRGCPFRSLVRSAFLPLFVLRDPALLVSEVDVRVSTLLLPVSLAVCVLLASAAALVVGGLLWSAAVCVRAVLPLAVEPCACLPLVRRSAVLPLAAAGACGLVLNLTLITCPFLSSAVVLVVCSLPPSSAAVVLVVRVSELLGRFSVAAATPDVLWRVFRRREENALLCLAVSVVPSVT